MEKKSLLHEIKCINGDLFRGISNRYKSMNIDITPIQAKIIMLIYNSNSLLCQKDLEKPISCNKSTMSSIISTMEKNGLIVRQVSDNDSRINYLVLTDNGIKMVEFLQKDRLSTEDILVDGISDEESDLFIKVIEKIRRNIERL